MTSPYLNPRATPSQLSRWADWMLSSRFVGIMTQTLLTLYANKKR